MDERLDGDATTFSPAAEVVPEDTPRPAEAPAEAPPGPEEEVDSDVPPPDDTLQDARDRSAEEVGDYVSGDGNGGQPIEKG